MQPTKPKPRSLTTPLHPKLSSLAPPVPPFGPPLTPPNPQFLRARWSSPTSGKAPAEGLTQINRPRPPNPAQLPRIILLLLPNPTHFPSVLPLLLSTLSSSLPVLSLHPSLPAQRTHFLTATNTATAAAHTLLPSARTNRTACWSPRLEPQETLGLSRIWAAVATTRYTHTHAYTERYTDTHGRNRQTLGPLKQG